MGTRAQEMTYLRCIPFLLLCAIGLVATVATFTGCEFRAQVDSTPTDVPEHITTAPAPDVTFTNKGITEDLERLSETSAHTFYLAGWNDCAEIVIQTRAGLLTFTNQEQASAHIAQMRTNTINKMLKR